MHFLGLGQVHPVYDRVMGVGNVTFFSVFPFFPLICYQRKHSSRISNKFVSNCLERTTFFFLNKKNKKFRTEKKHVKCYEEILEILQQALKCRFLGSYFLYEGTSCSFSCSTKENI